MKHQMFLLMNPLQRTQLMIQLQGVLQFDTKSSPSTGDGGYTGFAFAGISY